MKRIYEAHMLFFQVEYVIFIILVINFFIKLYN